MKPFSHWTKEEVEDTFNIQHEHNSQALCAWLNVPPISLNSEVDALKQLAQKLLMYIHDWNEEELKVYFIACILDKVNFYQNQYRPFMKRELSVQYSDNKRLWGVVDFVVAAGKQTPKQPFFFLHEYKKRLHGANDPVGQLLAAMVAAQIANVNAYPVYGVYVIERHWYFVVLNEKVYSESLAYDATKEDILNIVAIMRNTKDKIDQQLKINANQCLIV